MAHFPTLHFSFSCRYSAVCLKEFLAKHTEKHAAKLSEAKDKLQMYESNMNTVVSAMNDPPAEAR